MSWRRRRFGEMASFRNGLNFSADDRGGDLPVLGVGDFGELRLLSSDGLATVRRPDDPGKVSYLQPRDLVFVRSNGSRDLVGRCLYVSKLTLPTSHSGFTIRARAITDELNPQWAAACFQSGFADRALGRGSPGTNISNLTQGTLAAVELPVPARPVQDALLAVLDFADRAIALAEALLAAKRQLERGLMQDLLTGRRRLPEFHAQPWPSRRLKEVSEVNHESLSESTDPDLPLTYIDLSAVSNGRVRVPSGTVRFGDAPSRARRIVRKGDVLLSTVRPYLQGFAIVEDSASNLVCSTGFAAIRTTSAADAQFLLEVLFSEAVSRQTQARLVGSSYPALNERDVMNLSIPWPSVSERERIGRVLATIRREVKLLADLRECFGLFKRGLMQRLLSGDIEVPQRLGTNDRGPDHDSDNRDDHP